MHFITTAIFSFRSWSRQKKKQSTSTEGWIQDALSPRLAPLRHRKRGERLALTLLLLPPAGLWPTSLQAASNTPALSQSACSCVNRNRSVFCLFCGYFYEHVSGIFSIIFFFLMPWYVLTQPSLLLLSPFSNIKTNLLWNGQDVKKRCFSAFRLRISIVILWMHARLWDWDRFFALANVKSINSPRQQNQMFLISPWFV